MTDAVWIVALAGLGAVIGALGARRELADPPAWSLRTNVSGRKVPAVLGMALVVGGISTLPLAVAATDPPSDDVPAMIAAFLVLLLLGLAGRFDDRRGDETPRGFAGHLRAGRLTGGVVKIAAGGVAGVAAGALVHWGRPTVAVLTALAVPLAANLFNLLDRAPGRTGKVALLAGVPLLAFGDVAWALSAAGAFGALATILPADLGERGMLGDAGANPLGGLVGLGLGMSLGTVPLAVAVVLLLLLNAASERWSFSKAIERVAVLRKLDSIGRK